MLNIGQILVLNRLPASLGENNMENMKKALIFSNVWDSLLLMCVYIVEWGMFQGLLPYYPADRVL